MWYNTDYNLSDKLYFLLFTNEVAAIVLISCNEKDTQNIGYYIGQRVKAGDIILLYGDLGSGKTVLTRGIAKGAGVESRVTSPTFIIMNQYPGNCPIFHFDLYRLSDSEELYDLDFEDYLYGDGIAIVEWPEKMAELLPKEYLKVTINKLEDDDNKRIIKISSYGEKYESYKEVFKGYESTCR